MTMVKNGVVFGRFQPVHKGHIEHLLKAKENCKHLYVGITNPDPSMMKEDQVNKERSKIVNNPFTYYERNKMIESLLNYSGITNDEFTIVPFPLHTYDLIKFYCPIDATFFISIYEEWGIRKKEILKNYNLTVRVMFDHPSANREISGSNIRRFIMAGNDTWKEQVPKTTLKILDQIDLKKRLYSIQTDSNE